MAIIVTADWLAEEKTNAIFGQAFISALDYTNILIYCIIIKKQ